MTMTTTTKPTRPTGSAVSVLQVLEALSGHAVHGISNSVLATNLGMTNSFVTRAIATLVEVGWARKDAQTGHFHPTARMAQVFGRVLADFDKAETSLSDLKRSYCHVKTN